LDHATAQQRGRIGGLRRAALAPDLKAITKAARDGRWARYVERVKAALPELTDEAEITRRAEMLRRADMAALSLRAARARRLRAELRAIETDLDASGLDDTGRDGVDVDS
jgi:hypothetical protein